MAGKDEPLLTVGSLLAPLYLGLTFAIAFEGILLSQWYAYWRTYYNKDPLYFSLPIHALCLLELFHSVMILHAGYWYFINLWGEGDNEGVAWQIFFLDISEVLVTFVSGVSLYVGNHCLVRFLDWMVDSPWDMVYLLYRSVLILTFIVSRNWWLIAITGSLALLQLGLGIVEVYEAIHIPFFSTLLNNKGAVIAQMVASDLGDIIISISLCYYLHRLRTGHGETELLLNRLMRFFVTRGLLAALTGVAQLISFLVRPTSFIFGIFHLMFSKIYTNALLATLNGREYISGSNQSDATGTSLAINSIVPASSTRPPAKIPTENIEIIDGKLTSQEHSSSSSRSYTTSGIHTRVMDDIDPI